MRWLILLMLVGCAGDDKGGDSGAAGAGCPSVDLAGDAGSATVDDVEWVSESGQWITSGNKIQVVLNQTGPWGMTMVAITTDDGRSVTEALDEEEVPFRVSFADEGNYGSVREDIGNGANIYATNEPGGKGDMTVDFFDGETLTACFDFTAVTSAGVMIEVSSGAASVEGS